MAISAKPTCGSSRFWDYWRFSGATSLLECTMSKLVGRTGSTRFQCRTMDMVSQVRRTKAS